MYTDDHDAALQMFRIGICARKTTDAECALVEWASSLAGVVTLVNW